MDDIVMEIVQEKFDRRLKEAVEREVQKELNQKVEAATKEVAQQITRQVTQQVTQQVKQKTKLMDIISLIQKKCKKDKPLSVIADELEAEPNELLSVYNIVFANPGKTVDELYELAVK